MTDTDRALLELSTRVAPPKFFTVDDERYDLLTMDHFSESEEAAVMGLFQRYGHLSEVFDKEADQARAEKIALDMRKLRIQVLTKMTSMPEEIAAKLPMSGQTQIMSSLKTEMDALNPDKEEGKDAEGASA